MARRVHFLLLCSRRRQRFPHSRGQARGRTATQPDDADEGTIEASFKDGGLTVELPRAASKASKSRQIKIG